MIKIDGYWNCIPKDEEWNLLGIYSFPLKIRENMGDILEDWGKLRNVSNAKRPSIKDNGKPSTKNDSLDNWDGRFEFNGVTTF